MTALVDVETTALTWERILKRVAVAPDGCWLWPGATNSRGYGLIGVAGPGSLLVHRVAVLVRDGAIADGMVVDHTCHNEARCRAGEACPHRRCCNPDHLEVVTNAENCRRGASQNKSRCKRGHLLGVRMRGGKPVRCCRRCEAIDRKARREAVVPA